MNVAEIKLPVYRKMQSPAYEGQLRAKSWRVLIAPDGLHDSVWTTRCQQYWELQERTYGLALTNFTYLYDPEERILTTYSVVKRVLPGERR